MAAPVVASATAPGSAALAVVRMSGEGALSVLRAIARPRTDAAWSPGRARRVDLYDGDGVYDDAVALFYRAPRSPTGEDLVEISTHGNPRIVARLLANAERAGARRAEAGEFTRRALLNGKLDLAQAEGVLQIAQATSDEGLRVARQSQDGTLHQAIAALRAPLVRAVADLEARLDWPDDELAYLSDAQLRTDVEAAAQAADALADTCDVGRAWVHGARVALVGTVNAGKSSLFNALFGRARALVHERPGTTRDVLELPCDLDGLRVTLLDTAGERATDDPIEAAGLALARELVDEADLLLVVLRAGSQPDPVEQDILSRTTDRRRLIVYNGVDRPGARPVPDGAIPTSAKRGEGIDVLRGALREALVGRPDRAEVVRIASQRQRDHLRAAAALTFQAPDALEAAGPAVAADLLWQALREVDALTGSHTGEDVLDALFSRFCIGK